MKGPAMMSLLDRILGRTPRSASLAKERLQVIIAREGNRSSNPEVLSVSVTLPDGKHLRV
jgi:septum formation topological specificity factor MinE